MWWVWLLYILCLMITVFTSNKLAEYIDALDKKTKISGAFLGGILLAGITSLPELITSITAAILKQPEMTLGNILGSNVFDIAIIGVLMLVFFKRSLGKKVSKSNIIICAFTLFVSVLILLCAIFDWKIVIPAINVNILTPLILVLYVVAIWFSQKAEGNADTKQQETPNDTNEKLTNAEIKGEQTEIKIADKSSNEPATDAKVKEVVNKAEALEVKQIVWRFILLAFVLIGVSVAMTYLVDSIATTYNLGRGLAGALFLGIATSLPEIISSFTLVRLGNFDSAYGNLLGSCLFNFGVIALADICYTNGTVFLTDLQSIILSACLVVACIMALIFGISRRQNSKYKNSITLQIVSGVVITLAYIVFLILSVTIL